MARGKKKPYQKKTFESTGESSDTSANIYMSMLLSPAWRDLSANQQRLYLYCKAQYYAEKQKPKTKENPDGNETYFTMNRSKWCNLYCLYADNNRSSFYRDRDALIYHGFIRVVENGQNTRTKTVYALWDMWRKWEQPDFMVNVHDMSNSLLSNLRKSKDEKPP
jgi:hypothetical protein